MATGGLDLLLFMAPVVVVVALLASGRASLVTSGLIGLALTVPAVASALGGDRPLAMFFAIESGRGAWIAWQAISIIFTGLLFYQVLRTAKPALFAPAAETATAVPHGRLYSVCFLIGPFAETATGFGVGVIVALAALRRMGLDGPPAVALSLFSQILVPWGALAIGTFIGADLVRLPVEALGVTSAILSVPLLLGYLGVFWWLAARIGQPASMRDKLEDLAWTLVLAGLLYVANRYVAVEIACVLATAPLIALRFLRDTRAGDGTRRASAAAALPYGLLTVALLVTRVVPTFRDGLSGVLVIAPAADLPAFPVLYHASFWLLAIAVGYGAATLTSAQWRHVGGEVWRAARVPALVTLVFVVMAQLMTAAGIPAILAAAWVAAAGSFALAAVPVFGAVAGALTGSNAASNGMMMPLQIALAEQTASPPLWIAAVQNAAGSNFTALSPVRVAMGAAFAGLIGREREIYRLAAPLGIVTLVVLLAATAALGLAG